MQIASGNFVPLLTAMISATALLGGYMYQKHKEKEAEIRKTRQEIYSRLGTNLIKRIELLAHIQMSPEWQQAKNYQEQYQVVIKDAELSKNLSDQKEIATFLCLYGTDEAINAYANFLKEGWDPEKHSAKTPDVGKLVLGLRKSIYSQTDVTAGDANLVIFNDREHLEPTQL